MRPMKIKTLTWNIGGGKLLSSGQDPHRLASYNTDGLDNVIALLKAENADIVTLQETQLNAAYDQVKIMAEQLGYNYVHNPTSDSHIDKGCKLGQAILTRHKITGHIHGLFTNPNVEVKWEDGSIIASHDKGYTTCALSIHGKSITVTTLHLVPFRRFKIDVHTKTGKYILADVENTITSTNSNHAPWIIQGDFNIDSELLKNYLPKLFDQNTAELPVPSPTTPKGHKYDHIICRGGVILKQEIRSEVLTDHFPVIAQIEIA